MLKGMTQIPLPTETAPPNPFGGGRVVRELACAALALMALLAIEAGWEIIVLATILWLSHWLAWGWVGYRRWRAWRDGPSAPAGTRGGWPRSR